MLFLALIGCKNVIKSNQAESSRQHEQTNDTGTRSKNETPDEIVEHIKNMTLDEKVGQMVISGIDGYTNDEHSKELVQKYHIGGFILLGQNVKDINQVLSLINSLKKVNTNFGNTVPLFIGVDQEGGRIDRMPPEFKRYPTNKVIGEINNTEFSYSVGKALGQEIKSLGFNMDFAPVLDINSNPKNPIIGDRSFGAASKVVTSLGIKTMKGIQSENIISVVKHFPGHGDTSVDSHKGLPVVNYNLNRLKSFELVPFAEAIGNSADMVMVAHILFPMIDSQYPASMSKTIITDILRTDMNFSGIVITDDMTMGAIVKNYDIGEAAVQSVNAGSNIVLVCHDFDKETAVINALKAAAEKGTLSSELIDNSVYKILKLKQIYSLADKPLQTVDIKTINNSITTVLNKYLK
jgi:beta-N-acetylhexosaminidase